MLSRHRPELSRHVTHEVLGEMALVWTELVQGIMGDSGEVVTYRVSENGQLMGVATVLVIRSLDTSAYLSSALAWLVQRLARRGVGFLEIPLVNMPGLMTVPGVGQQERGRMLGALCLHLRKSLDLDAVLIKVDSTIQPDDDGVDPWALPLFRFYPNTLLDYPYASFDEFLASRSRKKLRKIRKDRRAMEEAGVSLALEEITEVADEVSALYASTLREVHKRPDAVAMPIPIDHAFFASVAGYSEMRSKVITMRAEGRMIANALLLRGGDTLFVKAVGLDYDVSHKARAYFNLHYGILEYAADAGCRHIDLGITNYRFKQWLGCELLPAAYLCDIRNPVISMFSRGLIHLAEGRIASRDFPSPFAAR